MKKIYKLSGILVVISLLIGFAVSCCSASSQNTASEKDGEKTISGKAKVQYTAADLSDSWDDSEAIHIALSDTYTIKKAGTYVFTGTLKDDQILVRVSNQEKVQIVLNGVKISCSDGPAIQIDSADKVFITLADGSKNSVTDGTDYKSTENQPWGAIFSKGDLTINGSGELKVEGNYNNGIVTKDDLRITGGVLNITAKNTGLKGHDSVGIYGGTIMVSAGKDGIKSDNVEKNGKGFVSIDGGKVNIINTTGQGIQGDNIAQITGGTVTIKSSNEGIQGKIVYIHGGKLNITCQDDGLNATNGLTSQGPMDSAQDGVYVEIDGGKTTISASGDGIDSNGDFLVKGGTTTIQGPENDGNGSLDYQGEATISGGTLIAVGTSAMAQNFDEEQSSQCALLYNGENLKAGTKITLTDEKGKELVSFKGKIGFSSVLISTPDMTKGKTYTLNMGKLQEEIQLTTTIVTKGQASAMGRGHQPGEGRQPMGKH